jgi:hypothetical protein
MGNRSIVNIVFCALLGAGLLAMVALTTYWIGPVSAGPG